MYSTIVSAGQNSHMDTRHGKQDKKLLHHKVYVPFAVQDS